MVIRINTRRLAGVIVGVVVDVVVDVVVGVMVGVLVMNGHAPTKLKLAQGIERRAWQRLPHGGRGAVANKQLIAANDAR